MLRQVVSRLNQWVDTQEKPAASQPDPMLGTLPADLRKLPMVEDLDSPHFTSYDGYMLMEAVWTRDAAKWAGGTTTDDLLVARRLFDWTIRNIETDYPRSDRPPQVPWETLFLGRGLPLEERAWTYMLLLRQRGIDAALLALPGDDSAPLKPWCVGVLIGDKEKKVYLFDVQLGLPIPAPGGIVADKSDQLDVQPATLDQVVADPKLLERLAPSSDKPYWVQAAGLKRVVALLESSPIYLSPRAERIEARLTGEKRLVLSAAPSRQAARFKAAGVGDVRLWDLPYTTLQRRLALEPRAVLKRLAVYLPFMSTPPPTIYRGPVAPLYVGRIMHLKGRLFDEKEAIACYQKARPRTQDMLKEMPKIAQDRMEWLVRQFKPEERDLTPAEIDKLKQLAELQAQEIVDAILRGKLDASYWLGLIEFEEKEYPAALDYFNVRVVNLDHGLVWAEGAHYNVGRCLEANGQRAAAIKEYESSTNAANLVRARWLRELDRAKKLEEK
jgi:hypothetical protein